MVVVLFGVRVWSALLSPGAFGRVFMGFGLLQRGQCNFLENSSLASAADRPGTFKARDGGEVLIRFAVGLRLNIHRHTGGCGGSFALRFGIGILDFGHHGPFLGAIGDLQLTFNSSEKSPRLGSISQTRRNLRFQTGKPQPSTVSESACVQELRGSWDIVGI